MWPVADTVWLLPPICALTISVVVTAAISWSAPQVISRLPSILDSDTTEMLTSETSEQSVRASAHTFVTTAVDRVGPAVVRIDADLSSIPRFLPPVFDPPSTQDLPGGQVPQWPREYRLRGQGSGIIVDPSGLILTNAHVVGGANAVTVTLRDGQVFRGTVMGIDEPSDLAVIKIEGSNLPVAVLGQSSEVRVGDWAIAVGNPLGLENTVSLGIISALSRSSARLGLTTVRLDLLQTDAAINPGNSGGPLLNDEGEVIGIISMIRPGTEGIGFAIPIDKATAILDRLARGERIPHPYVGIRLLPLTPELARAYNDVPNARYSIPEINGGLVLEVAPHSPAADAGLLPGDVVLEVEGTAIMDERVFQNAIEACSIGKPQTFVVQREDSILNFTVLPAELLDAVR